MTPLKLKGAIFDMDGTLLDSMGMWRNLGRDLFLRRNLRPPEDAEGWRLGQWRRNCGLRSRTSTAAGSMPSPECPPSWPGWRRGASPCMWQPPQTAPWRRPR